MTQQATQLVGATNNVCSAVTSETAMHRVLVVANETIDGDATLLLRATSRCMSSHRR